MSTKAWDVIEIGEAIPMRFDKESVVEVTDYSGARVVCQLCPQIEYLSSSIQPIA